MTTPRRRTKTCTRVCAGVCARELGAGLYARARARVQGKNEHTVRVVTLKGKTHCSVVIFEKRTDAVRYASLIAVQGAAPFEVYICIDLLQLRRIYIELHVCMHMYLYMCMYMYIYIHTHILLHIYICICIHIHVGGICRSSARDSLSRYHIVVVS